MHDYIMSPWTFDEEKYDEGNHKEINLYVNLLEYLDGIDRDQNNYKVKQTNILKYRIWNKIYSEVVYILLWVFCKKYVNWSIY